MQKFSGKRVPAKVYDTFREFHWVLYKLELHTEMMPKKGKLTHFFKRSATPRIIELWTSLIFKHTI